MKGREFRELIPKEALSTKTRRIINSRDKKSFRGIGGNDNMEGAFRHRDGRDNSDRLMPEDNKTARKTVGENSSPIPVLRNFPAKKIKSISISSGFNKTNDNRFVGTNKTENTRGGIPRRDAPAIPTYDFSRIYKNTV